MRRPAGGRPVSQTVERVARALVLEHRPPAEWRLVRRRNESDAALVRLAVGLRDVLAGEEHGRARTRDSSSWASAVSQTASFTSPTECVTEPNATAPASENLHRRCSEHPDRAAQWPAARGSTQPVRR